LEICERTIKTNKQTTRHADTVLRTLVETEQEAEINIKLIVT